MLDISVDLERNTGQDKLVTPYFAHVRYPKCINFDPEFVIPIQAAYSGIMKKIFHVDVCGFRFSADSTKAIPQKIEKLLNGLTRSARLPHYVFIARDAGIVYPVYTFEDEVLAPTPNGPLFQHMELAVVRERLSDYLHDIKVLGTEGRADKLHVRGISRHSLQLKRPRFYLKKRVVGEVDFWAPVFLSHDGKELYAYAASNRQVATVIDGKETFEIQANVASALQKEGRLNDAHDLRLDRLFATQWELVKTQHLDPNNTELVVKGIPIPTFIHKTEPLTIGLEKRETEDRYSLYMGDSLDDVAQRARQDFIRRGIGD